ncbi:hypothetical protein SAMN04488109_1489 [Chryseolinea serpens]|uniref:DUF1579 domain-containing protein n=1 Tax=Chryseolinea serpens TaxID=947013 RepID=A0A1M5M019_9BACT|nr:hypothetical protein [Chryseolinea serpens]SHG70621.1 hypothetical protein SAMN04488109_1489 [Chryseolinea serpens]
MISLKSKIDSVKEIIPRKYTARDSRAVVPFLSILFCSFIASASLAQNVKDTTEGLFHDDLLEHFVGKWNVSSIAHGKIFEQTDIEATWVMNHRYLRIHLQGTEVVPRLGSPMEALYFIGYNHHAKRYIIHDLNVFGGDQPNGGFCHGQRDGNELKMVYKFAATADSAIVQRFTWQPASGSWRMVSRLEILGKEQAPFLELEATPAALPTTKKNPSDKSGQ